MAAPYAALVSLMNNIEQILTHPRLSASLDNDLFQIQSLLQKASFLLDFVECYNHGCSKEAEDLERRIASAAHAAEDVIESHIVDQIHAGMIVTSPRFSLNLQRVIQRIDAVMEKAAVVEENHAIREEQPRNPRPLMETGETGVVGVGVELTRLLHELTQQQCGSSRRVISIVGMGGIAMSVVVVVFVAAPAAAITCSDVMNDLRPCVTYLKSGSGAPPSSCCTGASNLAAAAKTTADKQTACSCIKSTAKSISLQPQLAQALPANCGISLPFQISPNVDCSKIT